LNKQLKGNLLSLSPYILSHFGKRQGKTENFLYFSHTHFPVFTFSLFQVSGPASNKKIRLQKQHCILNIVAYDYKKCYRGGGFIIDILF
jgi:hypothetical protein